MILLGFRTPDVKQLCMCIN